MKKSKIIISLLLLICTSSSHAQLLNNLKNRVEQTAENHVLNDAGNATNQAIDKGENAAVKSAKNNKQSDGESDQNDVNNTAENTSTTQSPKEGAPTIATYKNYDFIPGDTVIFESDLDDERIGEIPSQFTLTDGQMDAQEEDSSIVIHIPEGPGATMTPRMTNENYMPDQFTIEFDFKNEKAGLEHLKLMFGDEDGTIAELNLSYDYTNWGGSNLVLPEDLHLNYDYPMEWHHIAVAVNKNQGKAYVDQSRVINVNNLTGNTTKIIIYVDGYENSYIKNVRVAAGGIDVYKKATTTGKIVMHGILFDIDKATLKPQSMGSINEIYYVLKKDPTLKFEIDGHTDNTGDASHNLQLSKERADAVKAQLVKLGVDGSRLTTKGFGDTKPISDNDTPEGKANNRRVEFVKI